MTLKKRCVTMSHAWQMPGVHSAGLAQPVERLIRNHEVESSSLSSSSSKNTRHTGGYFCWRKGFRFEAGSAPSSSPSPYLRRSSRSFNRLTQKSPDFRKKIGAFHDPKKNPGDRQSVFRRSPGLFCCLYLPGRSPQSDSSLRQMTSSWISPESWTK